MRLPIERSAAEASHTPRVVALGSALLPAAHQILARLSRRPSGLKQTTA